jgi:glycosyltransferase involved in cell wall biosynthesis
MTRVTLAAYRYAPAIGGAENYARRLLSEIGPRAEIDVVAWLKSQRTDWLASMIEGERATTETYEVDGRWVTALGRWTPPVRRTLAMLAPGYHVPGSPAPWWMGEIMAPELRKTLGDAELVHNVFMGREAFSAGWLRAARGRRLPFVFTPLRHERPFGWSSRAFRRLYRESDAVVALTRGEKDWLVAHDAKPDRVHVIGLGPQNDPSASPDLARETLGANGPLVLFIGQLHRYKGFGELVDAAESMQDRGDAKFVFVGPDVRGNAKRFEDASRNVRWLGSVSAELRDSLLSACTVLCVPSARESFGSVIVEAWACGKPVIGGPAAATRELIDEGADGFVVEQRPAEIADRLKRLLDAPGLAADMGCRGREKVRRKYSWSAIADAHLAIYQELVTANSKRR